MENSTLSVQRDASNVPLLAAVPGGELAPAPDVENPDEADEKSFELHTNSGVGLSEFRPLWVLLYVFGFRATGFSTPTKRERCTAC